MSTYPFYPLSCLQHSHLLTYVLTTKIKLIVLCLINIQHEYTAEINKCSWVKYLLKTICYQCSLRLYVELLSTINQLNSPVATGPNLEAPMPCAVRTLYTWQETVCPTPWYLFCPGGGKLGEKAQYYRRMLGISKITSLPNHTLFTQCSIYIPFLWVRPLVDFL